MSDEMLVRRMRNESDLLLTTGFIKHSSRCVVAETIESSYVGITHARVI